MRSKCMSASIGSTGRKFVSVLCLVALAVSTLPAQQAPAPTIRVTTHLVLVDVVATDKSGKPISGLKAEDFTVEEKGKKQKITFFSSPAEAQQNNPPELGPGIYSNKPEFRSAGGPVTVLLLDAVNTPFKDQAYARLQMLKYVREQLKPGQRIGVFTLANSLGVLQDFTSDPAVLLAALEKYRPQEQELQRAVGAPASEPLLGTGVTGLVFNNLVQITRAEATEFQNVQVAYAIDRRIETTLAAMRSLARILGGIPGRKEIIWLTAAFPFDLIPENRDMSEAELAATLPTIDARKTSVDVRAAGSYAASERGSHGAEIREVAALMSNAQVAIYPVD